MNAQIYAHRGASAYAPENTMPAFELAHKLGAQGIELDVQLTRDGKLAVIHDDAVDRTSNGSGCVADYTLAQLKMFDFGRWKAKEYAGTRIPVLEEVLDFIKRVGMGLNIELKTAPISYDRRLVEQTVEQVHAFGLARQVIISSFDHRSLCDVREIDKDLRIGLLYSANLMRVGEYARSLDAQFIHPHYAFIDLEEAKGCAELGIGINAWTVDDPGQITRLNQMGINIIITNKPNVALEAVWS